MASITVMMEKYDQAAVDADLVNLEEEIADEVQVALRLDQTVEQQVADIQQFVQDNKDKIAEQHLKMQTMVADLKDKIQKNMKAESATEELQALVTSAEVQLVASQIAELQAMSDDYHATLLATGRAGRPPALN